jgi:hypothetical protein
MDYCTGSVHLQNPGSEATLHTREVCRTCYLSIQAWYCPCHYFGANHNSRSDCPQFETCYMRPRCQVIRHLPAISMPVQRTPHQRPALSLEELCKYLLCSRHRGSHKQALLVFSMSACHLLSLEEYQQRPICLGPNPE